MCVFVGFLAASGVSSISVFAVVLGRAFDGWWPGLSPEVSEYVARVFLVELMRFYIDVLHITFVVLKNTPAYFHFVTYMLDACIQRKDLIVFRLLKKKIRKNHPR